MSRIRSQWLATTICLALGLVLAARAETEREPVSRRDVLLRAARNQANAMQFEKAAGYYRDYIAEWPNDLPIAVEFGGVLIRGNRTEEAVQVLQKVLQRDPDLIAAYGLLADAASMRKDWPAAIAALEGALARKPQDIELRRKLAETSAWSGEYQDAIRQYRMLLLEKPQDRAVWAGLLQVLFWAGMHDEYLVESERFLLKFPDDVGVHMTRVDLYAGRKNFAASAQECRDVLKVEPENRLAQARLAQFLAWLGEWEQARQEYGKALALSPDDTGLRREYGELLLWTGHYDEARDVFRRMLIELPGDEGVIRDYLEVLCHAEPLSAEDRQWVEDYHQRMFKQARPLRPSTLSALGRALKAGGKEAEALEVFNAALKANPEDMRLRLEYADILSAMGRVEEAEAQYNMLLGRTGQGEAPVIKGEK